MLPFRFPFFSQSILVLVQNDDLGESVILNASEGSATVMR